ncbi:mucin-5AC-like isoform X2 [Haliotis rubra]|uniref:mucin-5AC-like isoform X2 n=1 Tax=Haliotis rubra TaxID=36100 RepID=UPI001EE5B950|nr:mucin-5AC-like isoform X2 [Haliotis rubra]
MFGFIIGVAVMVTDYPVSGQTVCNPPNCHKVTITASKFTSVDNNTYTLTGQAAWVTDGVTSGQCASVASIYPAWEAELGQDRTVSRIKIFWEDTQDDVYVSVGGRICHSAASTEFTYMWEQEYTLVCDAPVTGNSLRIYRQPTARMLNLSLCEVEIYATSESPSTPPAFSASHGPSTSSTPATVISHGDTTSDVHPTLSITLDSATTTIAPTPTTLSSTDVFTNHANPTTTISLTTATTISSTPTTLSSTFKSTSHVNPTTTISLTTATTTSSTPRTPSSVDTSTSVNSPTSMNILDTTTITSFLETLEELHESTSNHFLAPSSTVTPHTASTSAINSNPTNKHTYFTWPTSSLLSSQGSSSVFRSTPVSPTLVSNPNLSFHALTTSEASTLYNTLQNMSPPTYMLTATTSLTAVSATTTTVNPVSETNVPAAFTASVTSTPASTKTTATTTLTSNGDTLTTTAEPNAAGTTPNVGQESSTEKAKTSNMNIVIIAGILGACVMLLYMVGITVFVWRQHRKAWYSPGRAK